MVACGNTNIYNHLKQNKPKQRQLYCGKRHKTEVISTKTWGRRRENNLKE